MGIFIGRIIGWLLLLAALVVLGRDIIGWVDTGGFRPLALGELWYDLDRSSLNLAQAVIQRYVAAWLWDPVIVTFLLWWAVPMLALPGVALLAFCRPAARGRHRR